MAKKIRVYELARELGLTSKEALDLALKLGIGVKSASSSIEDAQADRVRRKVDQEGLRRETSPEPELETKGARPSTGSATRGEVQDADDGTRKPAEAPARPASANPLASPFGTATGARSPESKPSSGSDDDTKEPEKPEQSPAPRTIARSSTAVRSSTSSTGTARPPMPPRQPRPSGPGQGQGGQVGSSSGSGSAGSTDAPPQRRGPQPPMRSQSGRPIPPPPPPMRSQSGRPIPPPPGQGGRPGSFSPEGGPRGPRRGPGGPGGSGGPGGGAPGGARGGGSPFGGRGGFPSAPPPPPGGRGGPPGRGRGRPPARKKRRRNVQEELEPIQSMTYTPSVEPVPEGEVIVERGSTAQTLGPKLNRTVADVVRFLMQQGEMVTATQSLTDDMIELFAAEIGATIKLVDPGEEQEAELMAKYFADSEPDPATLEPRPPVITVMGHVDHGKTSLLDRIRKANVTSGEAGGITQHIGAYQVKQAGRLITFIDTPGHEAFTAMRARGADVTDIVILVVAANDGVMPQTVEAIAHAKAAEVPIVVAINKIDKADANPERVMQQLSEHDLIPEAWGGSTIMVPVSAHTGDGISDLLEQVLLVADLEELQASAVGLAKGFVLEGNLDVGRGSVATVIVQSGTLNVGDSVVAGSAYGRVRALIGADGKMVKEATPAMPVQVIGLSDVPSAGDEIRETADERTARTIGETRQYHERLAGIAGKRTMQQVATTAASAAKLEDLFQQIQRGEAATLSLIVRADVQGSLEALTASLQKLERPEVKVAFVQRSVGGITENDVQLASTTGATIIGFNVRPDRKARELAEGLSVSIRLYEIIYRVIEDIENAMLGMLAPEYEEVVTGDAEVREIFRVPKVGAIAGCYVQNGVVTRGSKVRFLRDGVVIWKGAISSLKRFKDDEKSVSAGFECGIGLTDFQDLKPGDIIETYEEREIERTT